MSEQVERRLIELLGRPTTCPHGNPIPGLAELGADPAPGPADPERLTTLDQAADAGRPVTVRRISEQLQTDRELMQRLRAGGVRPDAEVAVDRAGDAVAVTSNGNRLELPNTVATLVFVDAP